METAVINDQLYVKDGDQFRPATEEERLQVASGGGPAPSSEADTATAPAADDVDQDGNGYVLNDDGIPARAVVRFQTGADDDGSPQYQNRIGRYRVDAAGAVSIEFPQPAEEGDDG